MISVICIFQELIKSGLCQSKCSGFSGLPFAKEFLNKIATTEVWKAMQTMLLDLKAAIFIILFISNYFEHHILE